MAGKFKFRESFEKIEEKNEEKTLNTQEAVKDNTFDWLFKSVNPHALSIQYLKKNQIEKNDKNMYSIDGIPALAESIKQYGLIQPLHVMSLGDDKYKLLGGERRLSAIEMLIADENTPEWTEDSEIPCIVKGFDDVKLDLSDENKERFAIITTNKEQRVYSDGDRYKEIQEWKKIIEELRSKGIEYISQLDADGKEEQVTIKGEKTRDIIAKATGMSTGQINKFEKVHNNASDELKEVVSKGKMSIGNAEKIVSKFSYEEQDKIAESINNGEEFDISSIEKDNSKIEITPELFKKDIKSIVSILKKKQIVFSSEEKEKYDFYIGQIEKLVNKK